MSTTFACPDCGRELRLKPGSTALRVKCPCGTILDVSDLVEPAEEVAEEVAEVVQSPPVKAVVPKPRAATGAARAGEPPAAEPSEPESVLVIDTGALKEKSNGRVARRDSSPRNGASKTSPARDDSVARHERAATRRATKRSGMPILWWAIGGGVVVLALVGMLLVYVQQNREEERLAKEREKKAAAAKAGLAGSQGGSEKKGRTAEPEGLAENSPRPADATGEPVPPKSEPRGGTPATTGTPKSAGPGAKPTTPGTGTTGATPSKPPAKDPALLRLTVTKQQPRPIVMPGGKSFLFCDVQPTRVRVASLESLEETSAVTIPDDFGWGRFLPDGKTLLASGSKGFRTYRTDKGFAAGDAPTSHLNTEGEKVSFELSANGRLLVANRDEFLEPLDTEVLSPKKPRFQRGESRGAAFALSPGGKYVAASDHADAEEGAAATDELHLWNAVTGERHQTIAGRFSTAVFSPDGKKLATYGVPQGAEQDKPGIRMWRTADGMPTGLQVGTPGIKVLAFSPDGLFLLGGGEGKAPKSGRLTLWDLSTGSPTHEFQGLGGPVVSASFTPDGTRIVCGCTAGEKTVAEVLVFDAAAHYNPGAAIPPVD